MTAALRRPTSDKQLNQPVPNLVLGRFGLDVNEEMKTQGYVFVPRWRPDIDTAQCAATIGSVLDVERLASRHGIPNVQTLAPVERSNAKPNTYSQEFGLSEFPLHTDYGHWSIPPRFMMLRCLQGDIGVSTNLLSSSLVAAALGGIVERAVVVPRRRHARQVINALPVVFRQHGAFALRWDSLFLRPLNVAAQRVGEAVYSLSLSSTISINLCEAGDTLVIDNWRMLHGRSAVLSGGTNRRVDRVYLEELSKI